MRRSFMEVFQKFPFFGILQLSAREIHHLPPKIFVRFCFPLLEVEVKRFLSLEGKVFYLFLNIVM